MEVNSNDSLEGWINSVVGTMSLPVFYNEQDLVYRLRERARICRQIPDRKSVQEGKPDRISDLLEESADEIEGSRNYFKALEKMIHELSSEIEGLQQYIEYLEGGE